MPIDRIAHLRQCGVFRDFTWPQGLPGFARYNLVYGWNATGKTTLSRLFRALEVGGPPPIGQVTMSVDGRDVSNEGFSDALPNVRVFNRDFVKENVFPTEGDVAPIFVLGKQSVEQQKRVDQLKTALAAKRDQLPNLRRCDSEAASALDRFCIERAKYIKETLRSSGSNPYNNYDKSDFGQQARTLASAGDGNSCVLDETTQDNLLAKLRAVPKPKLQPVGYKLPGLLALATSAGELLSATVASTVIQSLRDDPELASWVQTGLSLYHERGQAECLFCGRQVPPDRLASLESHFSTAYRDFMRTLEEHIATVQGEMSATENLPLPSTAELYADLSSDYEKATEAVRDARDSAIRALQGLLTALEDKKTRPFERVALNLVLPTVNGEAIGSVNTVIRRHNEVCDDFQSRIAAARTRLESHWVAMALADFARLGGAAKAADQAAQDTTAEIQSLEREIAQLEREIVEHLQPAEELNRDLHSYLGHDELRLKVRDTGYSIMRHDAVADALSEGETTAIALLYFLKSLCDRRFDLTKGVVVLDDPVSSLDANALYSAFGYIQERTQQAGQLFVLTHNFCFFRQVRYWFHRLGKRGKRGVNNRPAQFYMLDCVDDADGRHAVLRGLDPLLERYDSEYHYLFACIYRAAIAPPTPGLERNYVLANLGRRLLESFLAFRLPQSTSELWQKLQLVKFDEAKKIRILRFLHTHSHSAAIAEPDHDLSLLGGETTAS